MPSQVGPGSGEIDLQRVAVPVAPDDPAFGHAGFDGAVIRVTPGEVERYLLPRGCRESRHQHPGKIAPLSAWNNGRRLRERHMRFIDIDAGQAAAGADERAEGTGPGQAEFGEVQVSGKHAGQGGQVRGDGLLIRGLSKIGAAFEGEVRAVLNDGFEP